MACVLCFEAYLSFRVVLECTVSEKANNLARNVDALILSLRRRYVVLCFASSDAISLRLRCCIFLSRHSNENTEKRI